jgi:YidC/Oxa1 family membrane protein insertase
MPAEKNTTLRVLIPVLVAALGLLVAYTFLRGSNVKQPGSPTPSQSPGPQGSTTTTIDTAAPAPAAAQASTQPASPPAPAPAGWSLSAVVHDLSGEPAIVLGEPDAATQRQRLSLDISPREGAGLASVRLTAHTDDIKSGAPIVLQSRMPPAGPELLSAMTPFSAMGIEVTPAGGAPIFVNLYGSTAGSLWRPVAGKTERGACELEALLRDGAGNDVLRIRRHYKLPPGHDAFTITHAFENLSPHGLSVRFYQLGPTDVPASQGSYVGDQRRLRIGYMLSPQRDPGRAAILSDAYAIPRANLVGTRDKQTGRLPAEIPVWPNSPSQKEGHSAAWFALTNRYDMIAVYPDADPAAVGPAKTLAWLGGVQRVVADAGEGSEHAGLRFDSAPVALAPGASVSMAQRVYAGPMGERDINADPTRKAMNLSKAPIYNFGGPCAVCAFDPLTQLLLDTLRFLHDKVFKDWALSIIALVLIVRTILHPVTKWSQIRVQRFGKQMAGVGPKMKLVQEKYKNEPEKLRAEIAKVYREEGVNPAGALGCVPLFLQTPVWISLSAGLYYFAELRSQGAFYGLFQRVQPKGSPFWQFLGDLSQPDRLLSAGRTLFTLPMLGPITGLNILPILLGVVFWLQQKLTPQPTTAMTPEQEMQMKMMKVMTIVMFPLFMYAAPAGLALYFLANSLFAIAESKWIKRHIDKHGLLDTEKMKAEAAAKRASRGGSGGFFERMRQIAEQQQQLQQQRKRVENKSKR